MRLSPFIYPFPPRHCIASDATSTAFSVEYRMAPAQSLHDERNGRVKATRAHFTTDLALVTRPGDGVNVGSTCVQLCIHVCNLACHVSNLVIASFQDRINIPCINWKVPTGWPNCSRSWTYSTAWSKAACMSLSLVVSALRMIKMQGQATQVDRR
jgi:hypothetical protein